MKTIIAMLAVILFSCSTEKALHQSGTYKIKTKEGNVTTFEGVKGEYQVPNDTLKAGDKITINVIRKY